MMTSSYKLTDVFPEWLTGGGIFALLEAQVNPPWADVINGASLDVEYFGNRSGSKPCAPLIYKLIDDGELSEDNREKLVNAVWNRYGKNWTALYQTTIAEYNPIENYNMVEHSTMSDTSSISYGKTNTSSNSREATNTTSLTLESSNDGAYSGFNSSTPIPTDSNKTNSESQGSGRDTSTESTTSTDGGTDQTRKNITNDTQRSGNIGVTTSQQLLQSERELWLWNFADSMFADVDTMLTLAVFDHSECIEIVKPLGSYELPIASPTVLGGVMPSAKTAAMTQAVGVDGVGRLWVQVPEAETYTLPVATSTRLGGVKPTAKTAAMLQEVGVDVDGRLWTEQGAQSTPATLEIFLTIGENGTEVYPSWTDPSVYTYETGYNPEAELDTRFNFVGSTIPRKALFDMHAGTVVGEGGGGLFANINRYSGGILIDSTPIGASENAFIGISTVLSYDGGTFDSYELADITLFDSISDITAGVTSTFIHLIFYL